MLTEAEACLNAAIEQLGHGRPQVRVAGVYNLAKVADEFTADYRQCKVGILRLCLTRDSLRTSLSGHFD